MFNSSQSINSSDTAALTESNISVHNLLSTLRIVFGIIACLSVLGNGLVCSVILKKRNNLRNSYNLMILALAIVDTLTGMLMLCKYCD